MYVPHIISENRAVCEKKYGAARLVTNDNTVGAENMRFACWVTKARISTHTRNIQYISNIVNLRTYLLAYLLHGAEFSLRS
jgi:hypothetical protein